MAVVPHHFWQGSQQGPGPRETKRTNEPLCTPTSSSICAPRQRGPCLAGSLASPESWLKRGSSRSGLSLRKTTHFSNKNDESGPPFCADQLGVTNCAVLRNTSWPCSAFTRQWAHESGVYGQLGKGKPSTTTSSWSSPARLPHGRHDQWEPSTAQHPLHWTPDRWWPRLSNRRPHRQERTVMRRGRRKRRKNNSLKTCHSMRETLWYGMLMNGAEATCPLCDPRSAF